MNHINWQRTRDILISIIGLCIVLWFVFMVLGHFVEPLVLLILSMALAFLIIPLVDWLVQRYIPRLPATLLTYLVILSVLGMFGYGLIVNLVQQAVTFSTTINEFARTLPKTMHSFVLLLEKQGVPSADIQATISKVQSQAYEFATGLASNAFNLLLILSSAFLNILLVLVISFYLVLDGKRIRDAMMSVVPHSWLPNALLFEDVLGRVGGRYIRGQCTLALLVGFATALVCMLTGLGNYALLCGTLAFLFEAIPMVGPLLASVTPMVLSLLLPDPFPRSIVILACFVVIQLLESNILGPRIVGHAVGLHPVAAILTLLVGVKLFGIIGALLATPVVGVGWVIVTSIYYRVTHAAQLAEEEHTTSSVSANDVSG